MTEEDKKKLKRWAYIEKTYIYNNTDIPEADIEDWYDRMIEEIERSEDQ